MYNKKQLFDMVKRLYEDDSLTALGEEVDGGSDMPFAMLERFHNATGKYPAVCGIDLACYGLNITNASLKKRTQALDELEAFAKAGGIVTASSHFANPAGLNGNDAPCRGYLGNEDKWEELLTEGSELNTIWKAELLLDARFLKQLGERGVPVLWRPLHECNGDWFWFCITQQGHTLPGEYMARAWRYIYELYEHELKLDNLLWVYAPNITGRPEMNMWCYPGDEYVDIIGYDWYSGGGYEVNNGGRTHDILMEQGKPLAITEFGPTGSVLAPSGHEQSEDGYFNGRDMLALLDRLYSDGRKLAYLMTWTWHWGLHSWKYADELMSDARIVDRDRLAEMWGEI